MLDAKGKMNLQTEGSFILRFYSVQVFLLTLFLDPPSFMPRGIVHTVHTVHRYCAYWKRRVVS